MERPAWNLFTGTLVKYGFLFVNIVIGIFLMPFTMHHLGKAEYGLWMLAASMTAYLQLLDLGYGNGVVRQITHADARGDHDEVNTILSTFTVVYGLIGLLTVLVVWGMVVYVVPRFPNLSADQVWRAQSVLAILGVRTAIAFPMSVFGAVTTARQRFALSGSIAIATSLAQAIATYVTLRAGYGLVPLVAVTTAIGIVSYVPYAVAARRTFPAMRLQISRFSRRQMREVTSFSLYLFLISIAIQFDTNVDNLIIGATIGTSAVAVYAIAVRLADFQRQICGQFSYLMFPVVVRFHATDDRSALRTTLVEGTRLAVAMATGVSVCLIGLGPFVMARWMGPGFEGALPSLYVMSALAIVVVSQGPSGSILLGAGRHRLVGLVSVLHVTANLAISLALVSRFGLLGVALGTAIPYTVFNVGVLVPAACRVVGVPLTTLARTALAPAATAAVIASGTAAAWRATHQLDSVLSIASASLVVALVYALSFWFGGLARHERVRYGALIARAGSAMIGRGAARAAGAA